MSDAYEIKIADLEEQVKELVEENREFLADNKKLKECLKNISKYDTCWTCAHYFGSTNKYCKFNGGCDRNGISRAEFIPTNKYQVMAMNCLKNLEQG